MPASSRPPVHVDPWMGPYQGVPAAFAEGLSYGVKVADLNNDLHPDVVHLGSQGATVFITMPSGFPGPALALSSQDARLAGAWDVTGDGLMDVVVGHNNGFNTWELVLFAGDGAGTFSTASPLRTVYTQVPELHVLDWNRDNLNDMLLVDTAGTNAQLCLATGPGAFATCNAMDLQFQGSAAVADVTGDGYADLVGVLAAGGGAYSLGTVPNNGTSGHGPVVWGPSTLGDVGLGDVNQDQVLDAVGVFSDNAWWAPGSASGAFGAINSAGTLEHGARHQPIRLADLDQDGRLDWVVLADSYLLDVFTWTPQGTLEAAPPVSGWGYGVELADVNADQVLDLVPYAQGFQWLLGHGDLTFVEEETLAVADAVGVTLADANADGALDLWVASKNGTNALLHIFTGNAQGAFSATPAHSVALPGHTPRDIRVGDLNGDGRPDAAISYDQAGGGWVVLQQATGAFVLGGTRINTLVRPSAGWELVQFDGDGVLDLVVSSTENSATAVLLGLGDGSFSVPDSITLSDPSGVAVADFNQDGRVDLVSTNNSNVVFIPQQADHTLGARTLFYNQNVYGWHLAADDFNNDGKVDVLMTPWAHTEGLLMRGAGNGTSTQAIVVPVLAPFSAVRSVRANNDVYPDALVWGGGVVGRLMNRGAPGFAYADGYRCAAEDSGVAVADLNGDGHLEVVMVHSNTAVAVLRGRP